MEAERVVLVNELDEPLGTMEKLEAHRIGALHRAFSVFVFDGRGRLLLQKRADIKYHSGGLWTNTCCGHPRENEAVRSAAQRRLMEEMGIRSELEHQFSFTYRAAFANGLQEHEFDHVYFGRSTGDPHPDPREVGGMTWVDLEELEGSLTASPANYTAWLRECWPQLCAAWRIWLERDR